MAFDINGINRLPGFTRYWRQRRSYLHEKFVDWEEAAGDRRAGGAVVH